MPVIGPFNANDIVDLESDEDFQVVSDVKGGRIQK